MLLTNEYKASITEPVLIAHYFHSYKLVSHWHANFSRLFCEFCRGLSHDIRASVVRIFICRELVAKVLNMFKILCDFFFRQNISQDCRATFVRVSPRNFGEFTIAKFSRHSYECRASVVRRSRDSLEKTCEHLATIWRENKTKRHSYECHATLTNVARLSYE